ncbi:hypothetical protein IJD34_01860 [bacterium]|nr:hypothetical protein [bacterium]
MKIQNIQPNLNFEAKKTRYIDVESHEQLMQILRKMDGETEFKENEYKFESTRTTRLELINPNKNKKLAELIDGRRNLKKFPEGKDLIKETCLTIGKTELVIDNKTGKIIDYYKPFLKTWKKILKEINITLIMINASYYNSKHVIKHKFGIDGLTKKGAEILSKMKIK